MRTFEITYSPKFIKNLKKVKGDLKEEILNRIEMLVDESNHEMLKVHKLKGRLKDRHSFSVDYKNRIVFVYIDDGTIYLLNFGGHEVYN